MTEQSEHLSSAQIENYGNRTSGAGPEAAERDEHQRLDHQRVNDQEINDLQIDDLKMNDQQVEAHLADCATCRNRLLEFHRRLFTSSANPPEPDRPSADKLKNDPPANDPSLPDHSSSGQRPADSRLAGASPTDLALADSKFANPNDPADPQVRTAPTPECPSTEALRELAAGLTPHELAPSLTQHAATCNHCGPLLRTFAEDFSDDFSPEEQAALNNLQSSSAAWQKNTAGKMLKQALPKPTPWNFRWKWIMTPAAAAAACALLALCIRGVTWYARRDTPEKVAKYLAEAYPEQRTIEMRWPGAKWGEPSDTLGSAPANKPLSLLKADEAIQRQAPETLRKKEWLHLRAQNDILGGGTLPQLIKDLTEATQSQPDSTLMFDLAIANFRMGEVTHDRKYYEKSKHVLDEVLASFRSPAALYDRAVVEQRLDLKDAAIIDLSDCLEKETDREWKAEIQQKIQRLKASAGR